MRDGRNTKHDVEQDKCAVFDQMEFAVEFEMIQIDVTLIELFVFAPGTGEDSIVDLRPELMNTDRNKHRNTDDHFCS